MVMFNLLTITASAESSTTVVFSVQLVLAVFVHSPALIATTTILIVSEAPGANESIVFSPLQSTGSNPSGISSRTTTL